jgi:hypothetical protein
MMISFGNTIKVCHRMSRIVFQWVGFELETVEDVNLDCQCSTNRL